MQTLNSFKGYGKMDPADDQLFRRKTKRRIILIGISAFLLVVIATTATTILLINKTKSPNNSSPQFPISTSSSIKSICSITLYPDSCYSSLSAAFANSSAVITDPTTLFNLSLSVASLSLSKISSFISKLDVPANDNRLRSAVLDCMELIEDAIDRFNESATVLSVLSAGKIGDLKTWLSATIADQETCLDGFEGTSGGFREKLEEAMTNSTRFASNSLAIVSGILDRIHVPVNRRLLADVELLPDWVAERQRRVLAGGEVEANVTVAGDGTGNVRGVQAAVDLAPVRSLGVFVIFVKAGVYDEMVIVNKDKWNLVMIGEGMSKTIISGSKNFVDGTPTFSTATFGEFG